MSKESGTTHHFLMSICV